MIARLRFVLSEMKVGLRRNLAMAVSVLLVTFVTLTFVGSAVLLQMQVSKIRTYWYDRVQVSVFMCTPSSRTATCASDVSGVTEEQRQAIENKLFDGPVAQYVDKVYYESSQQAYDRFLAEFKDSSVQGNLTADQMPQSFRVKLKDPSRYEVVTRAVADMPGVDQVQDQSSLLNKLFNVLNGLTAVAAAFAVVMLGAAVLLIGTTVRLIAATRRREVEIMRLVGASRLLIQLPFMLEVTLLSVAGSVLAGVVLWAGLRFGVQGFLKNNLGIIRYLEPDAMVVVAPGLAVLGVLLGVMASLVTTHRHLRV